MRVLLTTLLLCSISTSAAAQTHTLNAAKYAALRDRLVTNFLVVGTESGMSMPAHIRHEPGAYVRWADATIDLGWYIGILAAEHAMRRDTAAFPGFDATVGNLETDDELAAALLALERLDLVADASFAPECPGAPALNGFFIRDDVAADFHLNFAGMTSTRSDFIDEVTNKEMSQDQVYHLLLGLALVHHLVDPDLEVRGRRVQAMALENAERIIRKMEADRWLIKNPVCDRAVARGPSALAYSPGTARIAAWFTDGAYFPETTDVAKGIWELGRDPAAAFYQDEDNLHMSMAIAAVGAGFDDDSLSVLVALAERHRWSLYPLAHQVLRQPADWCTYRDELVNDARAMLDELPLGEFPGSPLPGGPAVHGFTVSNRFIRRSEQHYVGPPNSEGEDNHGLDYMLLHNLTALAAPELWGGNGGCIAPDPAVDMGGDMGAQPGDAGDVIARDGGADMAVDAPGPPAVNPTDGSGCGCSTAPRPPNSGLWAVLGLFAWSTMARRWKRM